MSFLEKFLQSETLAALHAAIRSLADHLHRGLPHASLLVGFVGIAWRAVLVAEPAGPLVFAPLPLHMPPPTDGTLVVVSANLYHDYPRHRDLEARLEAFAELVEEQGADILLLQEVMRTPDFDVNEWLRARLGMAYAYARANGHRDGIGFEEGAAIFSRYPLMDPEVRQLSGTINPFSRRIGLNATVQLPGGTLEVFSVHLGLAPSGNVRQIEALQAWVAETEGTPVVIAGDFNAENRSERIQALQEVWVDSALSGIPPAPAETHTLSTPWGSILREHRLDYIFLAGTAAFWTVQETRHLETEGIRHSDHRVVVSILDIWP